ncbi:hypothetical protein [Haloechinothrix sp. LS1_15]|uniref:hypothetical protein n=1 Tax=Haloechinothrix sp. LS1_15 TaxID=2652248 RepID=UPI00294B6FF8|nr:hypothetical protein [Haloechinothrix sp. LS1_15]
MARNSTVKALDGALDLQWHTGQLHRAAAARGDDRPGWKSSKPSCGEPGDLADGRATR